MSQVTINIWNIIQSSVTSIFLALYPFIICLLYQIQHEMVSNTWRVQIRKMLLVTCLILQLAVFTFLRDQYVWNEQVNEQDQIPEPLLCGLSRFLYYGIIEISTYYLIIMIVWDETEAQNVCKHQLNPKIVQDLRSAFKDRRFHFSTTFKIYTFFVSVITLLPSSILPNSISNQFLDGIDSNYRCEISNTANMVSIINKMIFLLFAMHSSMQLRKAESRSTKSNTISFFIILPICISLSIFVTFNEIWLSILSLDNARKIGFIVSVLFAISMISNHIMMQSQAKKHIVAGARRVSAVISQTAQMARQSIMGRLSVMNNGVEPIIETQQKGARFSVPEITTDQYDSVIIKQDQKETVILLQSDDHEEQNDNIAIPGTIENDNNNEEINLDTNMDDPQEHNDDIITPGTIENDNNNEEINLDTNVDDPQEHNDDIVITGAIEIDNNNEKITIM